MWLYRLIISLILSFTVAGCGFEPLYKQSYDGNGLMSKELAAIEIEPTKGKIEQRLYNELRDLLNPNNIQVAKKYKLSFTLDKVYPSLTVSKHSYITRYSTVFTANYTVKENISDKVIMEGRVTSTSGYNATNSEFATYSAGEDASINNVRGLSEELRKRLIIHFNRKS